jgi:hypothetical protein
MNTKTKLAIIIGSIIILLLAAALFFVFMKMKNTEKEMGEMVELMTYEKQQLEDEYSEIALQIEGFFVQDKQRFAAKIGGQRTTTGATATRRVAHCESYQRTQNSRIEIGIGIGEKSIGALRNAS